jgi:hypothetical protein
VPAPAPARAPAPPPPVADDDWGGLELGNEEPAASAPPAAPDLDFDTEMSLDVDAAPEVSAPAPIELPSEPAQEAELAPMHAFVPPAAATGHRPEPVPVPAASDDSGEAALRAALSGASREVIEKIVWEVVPQLAETIIRENLDRLVKNRQG